MQYIWIGVMGLLGVFARYGMGLFVGRIWLLTFPLATFLINVVGAFLIGIVYVIGLERSLMPREVTIAVMVGFLGGFTTFSSFCLEAARLLEANAAWTAVLYFFLSPLIGLGASFLGLWCGRLLFSAGA